MTERATVRPPKPESKMPMGASGLGEGTNAQARRSHPRIHSDATEVTSGLLEQLGLRRTELRVDAVEQAADGLAGVDAGDGLGEQPCDAADLQLRPLRGRRDGVGGDDLR